MQGGEVPPSPTLWFLCIGVWWVSILRVSRRLIRFDRMSDLSGLVDLATEGRAGDGGEDRTKMERGLDGEG